MGARSRLEALEKLSLRAANQSDALRARAADVVLDHVEFHGRADLEVVVGLVHHVALVEEDIATEIITDVADTLSANDALDPADHPLIVPQRG
jgi:hypothetical protein